MRGFHDKDIFLLVSFPRSGNGWIRYLLTEALLVSNGIDLEGSRRETYKHNGINAHCIVSASGLKFGIENIFPDFYANDKIDFLNMFCNSNNIISENAHIKTHHLAFGNDVNILYLHRNPRDAFKSYFSMLYMNNDKVQFAKDSDEFSSFFTYTIKLFFNLYYQMHKFYVDKLNKGCKNIKLLKMEDMSTKGPQTFDNLLDYFQIHISRNEKEAILQRNPKIETIAESEKIQLEKLWSEELSSYESYYNNLMNLL
jgi:hypothetical protein